MKINMKTEKLGAPIFLLIVIAISSVMLVSSRWGVGVTHDSIFYLSSAKNLIEGNGLQWSASDGSLNLLTHFPPLYSLVIVFIMTIGLSALQAATWLAAILMGLNVFTVGLLLYHFSQSKILSILTAIALAVSVVFINLHLIALSEPLFIWLVMCSIGSLGIYFEKLSLRSLLVAAFFAALALLTRYTGIAIIATGFLAIALIKKSPIRKRIVHLLTYLVASLTPFILWTAHNRILGESMTNRSLVYHALEWGNRKLGFETISGWFTWSPMPYKITITISGFFLAIIFFWWLYLGWKLALPQSKDTQKTSSLRIVFVFITFSLVYLVCILFSLAFFDASTRLDNRILAPVYIAFLCALFLMFGCLPVRWQWVSGIIFTLLIMLNLPATITSLTDFRENGKGFTGKSWEESQTVASTRNAPAESVIYSNQGLALHWLTGKPIYEIPEKMDVVRNEERANYKSELDLMKERLINPGSFIVWFTPSALPDSVLKEIGVSLEEFKIFPDATLYATTENVNKGTLP
jgi:hypothetical protein